jgi:hypothetical protein
MFVSSSGIDTAATAAKAGQSNTGPVWFCTLQK